MFASDRILAVDVGASKLVVAEFFVPRGQAPVLLQYDISDLGGDPAAEAPVPGLVATRVKEVIRARGIRPAPLYLCISGQTVFPRYVKLPPVTRDKLLQIIGYEAEQNVPFPIEEVVWDYQLMSEMTEEGASVMLVAVKLDSVTRLTEGMQALRLDPEIVDAAPMALYNAFVHNYGRPEGCTMILDVGAKATGLLFVEAQRVFSRSVPVAGNAITQEIARTFEISFAEAEALKLAHGQVGLGGVSAVGEDEATGQMAKVIRNVVTRLHAEINRSINFYRSQQGGSVPLRVLLTGGASALPNMVQFFEDKLSVPVDSFNPLANLVVSDAIDAAQMAADVPRLGGVVGLSLRKTGFCPIEINLLPPEISAAKTFRRRQPCFAAAALGLVVLLLSFWGYGVHDRAVKGELLRKVQQRLGSLQADREQLEAASAEREAVLTQARDLAMLIEQRGRWLEILAAIQSARLDGMWVTRISPSVSRDGWLTGLEVEGRGFEDRIKLHDNPPQSTAIEVFRDRLRESRLFRSEGTDISRTPPGTGDYIRQFAVMITLNEPIRVQ